MKEKLLKALKENWSILLLEVLIFIAFCVFHGRFGDIIVDSFREAYIPWQMNEGNVIYKDIFCIYPPLGYIINAFLFKIFGAKIIVLKLAGLITSMAIFFISHKLAKIFMGEFAFVGIGLFLFSGFILSPNVFNAILPYSFGMLYSLLFILTAIYFCIKKRFPWAYLFYSLAILSKYEFIFLLPVLIFASKKENLKLNIAAFLLPIIAVFSILRISGCSFYDILNTLNIIKIMGSTDTLNNFYSQSGLLPKWQHIQLYLGNIFNFVVPLDWTKYRTAIVWAFPLISILYAVEFKKLNFEEKIFIISAILLSAKTFFGLIMQTYGVYFIPFALISLVILIPQNYRKFLTVFLILWSLIIGVNSAEILAKKDFQYIKPILEYVNNTPTDSKVLVLPEALSINFLTKRESDNKIYSLIPLYVETFGEEIIVTRLNRTKPDYIIINDFQTPYYIYSEFGEDYAINITDYILSEYSLDRIYDKGEVKFKIYKAN